MISSKSSLLLFWYEDKETFCRSRMKSNTMVTVCTLMKYPHDVNTHLCWRLRRNYLIITLPFSRQRKADQHADPVNGGRATNLPETTTSVAVGKGGAALPDAKRWHDLQGSYLSERYRPVHYKFLILS